eukprot:s1260_g5.t2
MATVCSVAQATSDGSWNIPLESRLGWSIALPSVKFQIHIWKTSIQLGLSDSKLSRTLGLDCRALEPHVGQLQMFETPRCVTPKRPGSGRGAPCLLHEGRAEHLALHHQACISGPKAASPISWLAYAPFTWKSGNRKMP